MASRDLLADIGGAEDDDVSFIEDDVPERPTVTRGQAQISGPASWEDVAVEELNSIAANIARNALPSAVGLEVGGGGGEGTRYATRAIDDGNADPLGFGRIDLQNLALVRTRGGGLDRTASNAEGRGMQRALTVKGDVLTGKGQFARLREKVLLTSEQFNPFAYLGVVHSDTSIGELLEGTQHLRASLSEQTGQLQALVRENFERFISCKTTIDDIEAGLKRAERDTGDGTNTNQVLQRLQEVNAAAHRAYAPLLERQQQVRSILARQQLMQRYETLLRLPAKLQQHAKQQDYDQVITEYRNAKTLRAGLTQLPNGQVWERLFTEVERVVEVLCVSLVERLRSPGLGTAGALVAVRHVLQLQAEGMAALEGVNPMAVYLQAQAAAIERQMAKLSQEHADALGSAKPRAELTPAEARAVEAAARAAAGREGGLGTAEELLVGHIRRLTDVITTRAPNMWTLNAERLVALPGVGAAGAEALAAAPAELARMLGRIMDQYSEEVGGALSDLVSLAPVDPGDSVVEGLREVARAYALLEPQGAPPALLVRLQELVATGASGLLSHLQSFLADRLSSMTLSHAARATATSANSGANALGVQMREALVSAMDALASARPLGAKVGMPALVTAADVRRTYLDAFVAFAISLDRLASDSDGQTTVVDATAGMSLRDLRLLHLVALAHQARTVIVPELAVRYGGVFERDEADEAAARMAVGDVLQDVQTVEGRLLGGFKESAHAALDGALEDYFFADGCMWDAAPLPAGVRAAALDLLHYFVRVEAMLYTHAPVALRAVMTDLVARLFRDFPPVLSSQLQQLSAGGLLQLWLEVHYFADVMARFIDAQVEAHVDHVKALLWLRIEGGAPQATEWIQQHEEEMLTDALQRTRLNAHCFRSAPVPTATGA